MMGRPSADEYAPFYAGYVSRVTEDDVLRVLEEQPGILKALASGVPSDREIHRYAPDKWSIRQVFGHLVDAERVFGYRAFCFSRCDETPLPSFDENAYVANASSDGVTLAALADEFVLVRESNLAFMRGLADDRWRQVGTASGKPVSVRALAHIMAGHVRHHLKVLEERYALDGRP
jgi:hypothetical protein